MMDWHSVGPWVPLLFLSLNILTITTEEAQPWVVYSRESMAKKSEWGGLLQLAQDLEMFSLLDTPS